MNCHDQLFKFTFLKGIMAKSHKHIYDWSVMFFNNIHYIELGLMVDLISCYGVSFFAEHVLFLQKKLLMGDKLYKF